MTPGAARELEFTERASNEINGYNSPPALHTLVAQTTLSGSLTRAQIVHGKPNDRIEQKFPSSVSLSFVQLESPIQGVNGVINLATAPLTANAEISAFNPASGYMYTVGGGSGSIVVSDLTDPSRPKAVAIAKPSDNSQTLQSVAVFGKLLAVAVQNTVKTDPGFVQFYDLSNPALPVHISTVSVGALPDMVKFSADGKKLLITNEAEPNSDYTIDPVGSISLIDTSGYLANTPTAPAQANVQSVDFSAWNNRKAELVNRGIRITGKAGVTTTVAQDIEPEAIAITADGKTA